jgi:hypothetical protein
MKRDGTVGRSDAIERSLPSHRDIDPARVMRPRFAEPIRASSPSGLHQRAGHMTASDNCSTRNKISCGAGGHPHMRRRALFVGIAGAALLWPIAAGAQKSIQIIGFLDSASPEAYSPMNAFPHKLDPFRTFGPAYEIRSFSGEWPGLEARMAASATYQS